MNNDKQDGYTVIDNGDLRKYRTEIPNIIDDMGLDVFEFRLYVHLKRVAGSEGMCWQGTRTLADKCGMSVGMVTKAKKGLVERKLIRIKERDRTKGETDVIAIVDIWQQNFEAFTGDRPVHVVNTPVHSTNTPVHVVNERSNPIKNEPMKKGESEAPPPSSHYQSLPGVQYPKHRRAKRDADYISTQRDLLGISAPQLTELTDTVLERMNGTALAALDTDMGNEELDKAQQTALALAGLGHNTAESVVVVFDTWYTHDWRGEKGDPPSYKQIVEHAKGMKQKVAHRNTPRSTNRGKAAAVAYMQEIGMTNGYD